MIWVGYLTGGGGGLVQTFKVWIVNTPLEVLRGRMGRPWKSDGILPLASRSLVHNERSFSKLGYVLQQIHSACDRSRGPIFVHS